MKENWELHWKDYYKILQVQPLAEPEVIKAAYDRLAHKYHPDTNIEPTTLTRMKELNEAFEILGNPQKRTDYDVKYNLGKEEDISTLNASNPSKPQPETMPKAAPDVTDNENQASNSRNVTKRRKLMKLPVFTGIMAIAIIIVLGIALLHFNKASKAGQSQTYTVGLPTITLTHPNSGETWHVGDVVTITWTSTNLPEDTSITVYILSSNGMDESITGSEGVPNTGSYKWTVPNSVAGNSIIGTHERIDTMITGANPYSPGDGSAYSPVFTIAE